MINELVFFNAGGNGDLHICREFCKHFMQFFNVPTTYAHRHDESVLQELNCKYMHLDRFVDFLVYQQKQTGFTIQTACVAVCNETFFFIDDKLCINTYVSQRQYEYLARNMEEPYFHTHYVVWSDICAHLRNLGINIKLRDRESYIPKIDFKNYKTNVFLPMNKINVLVSNGAVRSKQSNNFDFDPIIKTLAETYEFCNFYMTADSNLKLSNTFVIDNIYPTNNKSNLNEIAYLSTFCDIIVGRSSGPDVFTLIQENIYDSKKAYICFCAERRMAHAFYDDVNKQNDKYKVVWHKILYEDDITHDYLQTIESLIAHEILNREIL